MNSAIFLLPISISFVCNVHPPLVKVVQYVFLNDSCPEIVLNGEKPVINSAAIPNSTITATATITKTLIGSSTPFIV